VPHHVADDHHARLEGREGAEEGHRPRGGKVVQKHRAGDDVEGARSIGQVPGIRAHDVNLRKAPRIRGGLRRRSRMELDPYEANGNPLLSRPGREGAGNVRAPRRHVEDADRPPRLDDTAQRA
jgi:hypothetical protein